MIEVIPFIHNDTDDLICHTYLIKDNKGECIVVDPGASSDGLLNHLKNKSLTLKAVFLTHAHVDHMRGVDKLVNFFRCPLYVGFDDEIGLTDEEYNCAKYLNEKLVVETKATTVCDNEKLNFLGEEITVIYTPFHTRGSVCYYLSNSGFLFSGDTLFKNIIGRTDLISSTRKSLRDSLEKLKKIPDDVKVYPGHGEFTTIGREKKFNLFLNR